MLVLPDGAGLVSETERCTRGTSVVKPLKVITGSNLADMARGVVRTHRCVGGELLNRSYPSGREAAGNVYGVLAAMPQGQSWAPLPSNGDQ